MGVHHRTVQSGVSARGLKNLVRAQSLQNMSNSTTRFWPVSEMDDPFLIPNRIECLASHGTDGRGNVRSAEGTKSFLVRVADVRRRWIRLDPHGAHRKIG